MNAQRLAPPAPGVRPVSYIGLGRPTTTVEASTIVDCRFTQTRTGATRIELTADNGTTAELIHRTLPGGVTRISKCANWATLEPLAHKAGHLENFYRQLTTPTLGRGA